LPECRHESRRPAYLFQALTCIPIDKEAGRQAGVYLRQYRRSHGIEIADALITAGAVATSAELWT
jgi:predicted nucleic acid-binding protein